MSVTVPTLLVAVVLMVVALVVWFVLWFVLWSHLMRWVQRRFDSWLRRRLGISEEDRP